MCRAYDVVTVVHFFRIFLAFFYFFSHRYAIVRGGIKIFSEIFNVFGAGLVTACLRRAASLQFRFASDARSGSGQHLRN